MASRKHTQGQTARRNLLHERAATACSLGRPLLSLLRCRPVGLAQQVDRRDTVGRVTGRCATNGKIVL